MSESAKDAPRAEKAIKDLEPDAASVVGGRAIKQAQTLASNVQKKLDDTISGQQQKIG